MDVKYIVAIIIGSLFFVVFLIYLIITVMQRNTETAQRRKREQMYTDRNLIKMEYDFSELDAETEKIISAQTLPEEQLTIEDVIKEVEPSEKEKIVNSPLEPEGIGEIAGTYKP